MASISSPGIGSGLDIGGLVSQLVAAERAPQEKRLATTEARLTTEFTAIGTLKGALSTFQAALAGLKTAAGFTVRRASVSDETALGATASAAAATGRYDIEVVQLAQSARLSTAAYPAGPSATVGTGRLNITVGGNAFSVDVTAANNSLSGLRDAINSAAGNTGVRATLLNTVDGTRLVLTGERTGAANAVRVTQDVGGTLDALVYDPPNPSGLSSLASAQDAIVNIAGFQARSATNSVDGAIDGVVLSLKKAAPGTTLTLDVTADETAVREKVSSFVTAYNALAKQVSSLRSFDPATRAGGPMLGDPLLLGIEAQMRRLVSSPVAGTAEPYRMLSSVGISFAADGTLALRADKLQSAMAANPAALGALFGSADGAAARLSTYIDGQLATAGGIGARNASIEKQRKDLVTQRGALDVRMAQVQARLQKQFSALDTMLSRMQSTSTYLSQQLQQSTSIAKKAGS